MEQLQPLDPRDPDTLELILAQVDNAIQYHDDVEPKTQGDDDDNDGVLGGGGREEDQPAWAREVLGGGGGGGGGDE